MGVQQNTMKKEWKSTENVNFPSRLELFLNNYDVVGESYKVLESLSRKTSKKNARHYSRDYYLLKKLYLIESFLRLKV